MIKAHPTQDRIAGQAASGLIAPGCGSWTNAGFRVPPIRPSSQGVRRPSPQVGTTDGVHEGATPPIASGSDDRGLCILLVPIKGLVDGLPEPVVRSDEEEGDDPKGVAEAVGQDRRSQGPVAQPQDAEEQRVQEGHDHPDGAVLGVGEPEQHRGAPTATMTPTRLGPRTSVIRVRMKPR
jgi:hypothetical protein